MAMGEKEEQNFLVLKVAMAIVPILHLPNFEHQFIVKIDASWNAGIEHNRMSE